MGSRTFAHGALRPSHRGRWECSLPPRPQLVPRAPVGRRRSGVLAADAVAWLLLWAAGLVGRLAADISDTPFSSGKGPGLRECARSVGAGGEHPQCYGYQGREEVSNKGLVRPCPPCDLCAVFHPGHRSRALSRGGTGHTVAKVLSKSSHEASWDAYGTRSCFLLAERPGNPSSPGACENAQTACKGEGVR